MKEHIHIPEGYSLPQKAHRLLDRTLLQDKDINIVALSCPDYASADGVYTFDGQLGDDVPLLTKLHADAIEQAIRDIDPARVHLELLIADIESENTSLVNLYTGGDYEEYKHRCDHSMDRVSEYLRERFPNNSTVSSSFMRLGDALGSFVDYRNTYFELLLHRFSVDYAFGNQVLNSVRNKQKGGYYQQEYGGAIEPETMVQQELLTMAEYLSLGCILGRRATSGSEVQLIVSHMTSNAHLFNKMGDFSPETFAYDVNTQRLPLMLRKISVVATADKQ